MISPSQWSVLFVYFSLSLFVHDYVVVKLVDTLCDCLHSSTSKVDSLLQSSQDRRLPLKTTCLSIMDENLVWTSLAGFLDPKTDMRLQASPAWAKKPDSFAWKTSRNVRFS